LVAFALFVGAIPPQDSWLELLKAATEPDAVRILETRKLSQLTLQFLVSTQPHVAPSQIVRSVKGRLHYILKKTHPKLFHRNYGIYSIGEVNHDRLAQYVAKQADRHPMADPRVQRFFESLQLIDATVDLARPRLSSYGQFLNSLQIVVQNRGNYNEVSEPVLAAMRSAIIGCCEEKEYLLSQIGLVANHMHILLGCDVNASPQAVSLSLLNNLADAIGMRASFKYSFYTGTFGPYDRDAIRMHLI
jgi:REP element-mobilizing transposase RayT